MAKQQIIDLYPIRVCAYEGCINYTDKGIVKDSQEHALCTEHRNADGVKSAASSDAPQGTSLPVPTDVPEGEQSPADSSQ